MRARRLLGLGTFAKPSPHDDSLRGQFAVPAAASVVHGSADDDDTAIKPFLPRLLGGFGRGTDKVPRGYIPSYAPLHGRHFRVGYQGYAGVVETSLDQQSEGDSVIGMPTRIRPPLIPRKSAGIQGIQDAMSFVMSQPNNWGVIQPRVTRR